MPSHSEGPFCRGTATIVVPDRPNALYRANKLKCLDGPAHAEAAAKKNDTVFLGKKRNFDHDIEHNPSNPTNGLVFNGNSYSEFAYSLPLSQIKAREIWPTRKDNDRRISIVCVGCSPIASSASSPNRYIVVNLAN